VKLNDEVAEVVSATATQLTIIVPVSAYSGKIAVTVARALRLRISLRYQFSRLQDFHPP
jgi:hypothetical protein